MNTELHISETGDIGNASQISSRILSLATINRTDILKLAATFMRGFG